MRRLFSTFAPGWPGVGLLLLRLVAGLAVVVEGIDKLQAGVALPALVLQILGIAAGILLLAGLWTPIAGSLVTVVEVSSWILARPADLLATILLAAIGLGLALLGPGAWSVDARLFGWKRIDVGNRKS